MKLSPFVESLRQDLERSVAAAGQDAERIGGLLAAALDPAARLALMDAISATAAEVSAAVHGVQVQVRLAGRDPEIVVNAEDVAPPAGPDDLDSGTSRITLRLPDSLKSRVETRAERDGQSVNAWLVQAVRRATEAGNSTPGQGRTLRGYART